MEPGYTVTPGSIKVHGAYIDGLVVNTTAGVTFNLRITAYSGTARIHITEAGSAQPRFEVPFVLSEDLGQHQKSWNKVKRQANSLRARLGDSTAELRLQYDPFMIDLGIDNRPAVSINSRQMFQIEHHRKKQVWQLCVLAWRDCFGAIVGPSGMLSTSCMCRRVIQRVGGRKCSRVIRMPNPKAQRQYLWTLSSRELTMCMASQSMRRDCHWSPLLVISPPMLCQALNHCYTSAAPAT